MWCQTAPPLKQQQQWQQRQRQWPGKQAGQETPKRGDRGWRGRRRRRRRRAHERHRAKGRTEDAGEEPAARQKSSERVSPQSAAGRNERERYTAEVEGNIERERERERRGNDDGGGGGGGCVCMCVCVHCCHIHTHTNTYAPSAVGLSQPLLMSVSKSDTGWLFTAAFTPVSSFLHQCWAANAPCSPSSLLSNDS